MKYIIKLNNKIISKRNTHKIYNFCALTTYKLPDGVSYSKTECSKNNIYSYYDRQNNFNILFRKVLAFPEAVDGVRTIEFNCS